jgi:hypothetical protein
MSFLIRLAIYAAIAAALAGAVYGVIHHIEGIGYKKAEAEWRPRAEQAEAALERQRQYAAGLVLQWNKAQDESAAAAKKAKEKDDELNRILRARAAALPPAVAAQPIAGAAVSLLNAGAAATADAPSQAQANGSGVAAPDTGAAAADTSLGQLVSWGLTVEQQYKSCRDQVKGWNLFFDSLWEDQP